MDRLVTIDEAIAILQKLKDKGEEVVLMSGLDLDSGITCAAIPISINYGMLVVKKSKNQIEYVENCIMKSLKTQTDIKKINTIMFH